MELWLDTTDEKTINDARELEVLFGVTTNPSILASSGQSLEKAVDRLLNEQEGPVAVQAMGSTPKELMQHAKKLIDMSSRIIVKIPASKEGYPVMQSLSDDGVPFMATAIFEPYQAYLSLKLGAHYIAPYLGRIAEGKKALDAFLSQVKHMQIANEFDGKILAAGIKNLEQFSVAAEYGCEAATVSPAIFEELFGTPAPTQKALDEFSKVWKNGKYSQ